MDIKLRLALRNFMELRNSENAMRVATELARLHSATEEEELQIQGVFTVSTSHITEQENNFLEMGDAIHHQDDYSHWIYTTSVRAANSLSNMPNVARLITLAKQNNCEWLRIDRDGPELQFLPRFDW